MYTTRTDQMYTNDTLFWYYKDLDENLALFTQKLKNQNVVMEKWQPFHFHSNPPFQGYPLFPAKILVPSEVTQFLEGPTPYPI